jgi:hypothetical protein
VTEIRSGNRIVASVSSQQSPASGGCFLNTLRPC